MIDDVDLLATKASLTAREILVIEGLSLAARVHYFVQRTTFTRIAFCLEDKDGIFVAQGEEGRGVLPIWPTIEQAVRAVFSPASTSWQECAVVTVDWGTLIGFLRQAAEEGDDFLLSPGPDFAGTVVPAGTLIDALNCSGVEGK